MLEAGGRRVLVGGNIGYARSGQVEQSTEDTIHVVGACSFQLAATETFRPWVAVLLNFSPDHSIGTRPSPSTPRPRPASSPTRPKRGLGGAERGGHGAALGMGAR